MANSLIGIQTTFLNRYRDSAEDFMNSWRDWLSRTGYTKDKITFKFVWIVRSLFTPDRRAVAPVKTGVWEERSAKPTALPARRRPAWSEMWMTAKGFNAGIGEMLEHACVEDVVDDAEVIDL